MPPDTADRPDDAEARRRAHDALDRAFTHRTVRGAETTGVNLSRFTDALRELDVPIEVRRRERPGPDPSAEAATKSVAAATPRVPAPFRSGARVRKRLGAATDLPEQLEGVAHQVYKQGGVWLAEVRWDNGGSNPGFDCAELEVVEPEHAAVAAAVRKETGQGLVTVVVGGARFDVEWHPDDEQAALIERGLRAAGVQPPAEGEPWRVWQLRDEAGALLNPAEHCGLDFDASEALFLDPAEGGGAGGSDDYPEQRPHMERQAFGDAAEKWPPQGSRERAIFDVLLHAKVELGDGIARPPHVLKAESVSELAAALEAELRGVEKVEDLFGLSRDDEWVQRTVMFAILAGQDCDVPFPADVLDDVLRSFGVRPTLPRTWPGRDGEEDAVQPAVDEGSGLVKFAAEQKASHARLREEDPKFAEYHRGAEVAYDLLHERLLRADAQAVEALRAIKDALDRLDAPQLPSLVQRIDGLYREMRDDASDGLEARRELIGIANDLDRVCIPRAIDADVLETPERVALLVRRYSAAATVTPPQAEELTRRLAAGEGWRGTPPAEGTRRALILATIQKEDVLSDSEALEFADAIESELLKATIEGEESPEAYGNGLSESTGQRIARALETLATSTGGALRELLDRTATDRSGS